MLKQGYRCRFSDQDFRDEINPGTLIYCPHCMKPLMEAEMQKAYQRCKHCRKWVYMEKDLDKTGHNS